MESFDIVVATHLRWSFVWQRPQQLLSRLARRHRILIVEEPEIVDEDNPVATATEVMPNVFVFAPRVPATLAGNTPAWLWPCQELIQQQVRDALRVAGFGPRALWFYTPTPEFLLDAVKPDMVVYDVMDELSNFKCCPEGQREREARLLAQSAVVFTGGASLYEAKKSFNSNTHLFASGVDAAHYAAANHPDTTVPDWMNALPAGPRATYIGVIDERMDYDVIRHTAQAHPDVQFLICGPVVKVDPASLPQGPNLHYPGQQQYADLPRILKGTDVCLMPFARNEATRFISPTKTLEYMAADRPIVSTPIRDVEIFYSDIVFLAENPEAFAAKVGEALNEPAEQRVRKRRREEKILAEQAWDAIADNMDTLMHAQWNRTPVGRDQKAARILGNRTSLRSTAPSTAEGTTPAARFVGGE